MEANTGRRRSWIPEVGDVLIGTLATYAEATDKKGREHRIAVVQTEEGERVSVWLLRGSMQWVFDKENPVPGDRLRIERLSDYRRTDGAAFKTFKLDVRRAKPAKAAAPQRSRKVEWNEDSPL